MDNPLVLRLNAFTRLSTADREALDRLAAGGNRNFSARHDLIREGERPRSIFLMLAGWACRYKQLEDGRRQIVALFLPGDLCDLNVFILKEMDHSIGAITKVRAAEVSRADFERIMDERPRINQALFWNELVTVSVQREWIVDIGQRSAYERLAHLFCELFVRLQLIHMTDGNSFDFPLTQADLAEAMGLTPVHVNRTLRQLREEGLIEPGGKRMRIVDFNLLRNAAQFSPNYLHLGRVGQHLDAND